MNMHACIRANKKAGKIDKILTGRSSAMLSLWAMQNTTSTKVSYVFEIESGDVVMICTGIKGLDFPEINKKPCLNIEDICPGICITLAEEAVNQ